MTEEQKACMHDGVVIPPSAFSGASVFICDDCRGVVTMTLQLVRSATTEEWEAYQQRLEEWGE